MPSTKLITGYVHDIAHKFDVSCQHIRFCLVSSAIHEFRANLITGEISPEQLDVYRNRNLVCSVQEIYIKNVSPILGKNGIRAEVILSMKNNISTTTAEIENLQGKVWTKSIATPEPLISP